MQFTTLALSALAGLASAQTVHVVSVSSSNASLTFSPDNLQVPAGDMIQFQFRAGNHSVVQSNFDNPCTPISMHTNTTGIFSGYQPVAASSAMGMVPTYTIMVSDTTPLWFYCSQGKHCQAGMVMVVNENTAKNATRSLENFKSLAKSATANLAPGGTAQEGTSGSTGGSTGGSTSGSTGGSTSGTTNGTTNGGTGTSGGDSPTGTASATGTPGTATASSTNIPVQAAASSTYIMSSFASIVGVAAALFLL
ncbi:Cupredoxin [Pseudomassariella vexata]|uniref:Cupredoxin n=1 Tax=Pseudomassariella vexata TaxID=1141098 RepID=A0A1Y2DZ32_9PEZI|nr:Cupredoxin [Pseudomassariella vexata]ORY64354.1 Cupredoxin [Pseudomassariella vexata]